MLKVHSKRLLLTQWHLCIRFGQDHFRVDGSHGLRKSLVISQLSQPGVL